jgi:transposase
MEKKSKSKGKGSGMLVTLEADAAGVDIGAEEIYVAVPPDRDDSPVRSFGSLLATYMT